MSLHSIFLVIHLREKKTCSLTYQYKQHDSWKKIINTDILKRNFKGAKIIMIVVVLHMIPLYLCPSRRRQRFQLKDTFGDRRWRWCFWSRSELDGVEFFLREGKYASNSTFVLKYLTRWGQVLYRGGEMMQASIFGLSSFSGRRNDASTSIFRLKFFDGNQSTRSSVWLQKIMFRELNDD